MGLYAIDGPLGYFERVTVQFRDLTDEPLAWHLPGFELTGGGLTGRGTGTSHVPIRKIQHLFQNPQESKELRPVDAEWLTALLVSALSYLHFKRESDEHGCLLVATAIFKFYPHFAALSRRFDSRVGFKRFVDSISRKAALTLQDRARRLGLEGRALFKSAALCRRLVDDTRVKLHLSKTCLWPECLSAVELLKLLPDEIATVDDTEPALSELFTEVMITGSNRNRAGATLNSISMNVAPPNAGSATTGTGSVATEIAEQMPEALADIELRLSASLRRVLRSLLKRPIIPMDDLIREAWRNPIATESAARAVRRLDTELNKFSGGKFGASISGDLVRFSQPKKI
jgi:hypothetical protein